MRREAVFFRGSGSAMQGVTVVCMLAAVLTTGCASTAQSIKTVDGKFRALEVQAREDMLAGRHAAADTGYATAAAQIDKTTETYVHGYFYLDHARMAGNRAFMALLDGNHETARKYFSSSRDYLTSGIRAHEEVLRKREDSQRRRASIFAIAAAVGVVASASKTASDATTIEETNAIFDAARHTLDVTFDAVHSRLNSISDINKSDVHEEAKYIDPDAWRVAVISDHPISQAVVRVFTPRMDGTNTRCTGFFIQPRLIATSAHCLNEHHKGDLWVEVQSPREEKEQFLLGKSAKRLSIERVHWPRTYQWNKTCHPDDIALIVVGDDSRSDHWLPLDTRRITDGSEALIIGYSGDLDTGFFQRMDYGCKMEQERKRRMMGTNCASYGGNSGGPILSVDHNRAGTPFRVVGIQSCSSEEYRGKRSPGIAKWAAGSAPLKRLARLVIAKRPSLGDPKLFQ